VRFTAGIDWPVEQLHPVAAQLAWQRPPDPMPRKDLSLECGPASWQKDDYNRPRTVRITRDGASGEVPLAGIQPRRGRPHRDKHNR
jgi:hypothetical protein